MKAILSKLFRKKRSFSAWQIELTTRCLLRCRMCVKESGSDWVRSHMTFDDFRRITPYFKGVERIVLEGWGESLLYPRLTDCIRLVKEQGAEAGFVTSGTGLDRAFITELLNSGLDFLGISFSGACPATHNSIRKGSDFEGLIESVRILQSEQKSRGLKKPRVHLVYLMLRDNIEETAGIVDLAKQLTIKKVALINPILISNSMQDAERVFADIDVDRHFAEIVQRTAERASACGIELVLPALSPIETGLCGEDPLRNLYISADGEVSPCVYLNPPVGNPFTRFHGGKGYAINKISFGNVFKTPFPEIWNSSGYKTFRKCFQERQAFIHKELQASFGSYADSSEIRDLPEIPEACRRCYKLSGF